MQNAPIAYLSLSVSFTSGGVRLSPDSLDGRHKALPQSRQGGPPQHIDDQEA